MDEGLDSGPAIGVIDGGETIVGPVSVDSREGEGERCEGGGSDGEDDWCVVVRKWAKLSAQARENSPEMKLSRLFSAPNGSWLMRASQGNSQAENCWEKMDGSNGSCPLPHSLHLS